MTHEVVLQGYNVKPGSMQLGTFDSYGIEKIHVTADDEWAGLDILAVFHAPDGTATKVVVGADGMLAVPPEATAKQAGVGRIVFVGLAEKCSALLWTWDTISRRTLISRETTPARRRRMLCNRFYRLHLTQSRTARKQRVWPMACVMMRLTANLMAKMEPKATRAKLVQRHS